ncbi:MAG: LysM peptidoglycan-binding domain-containing protein [Candidatus Omnitrophota bacterium]
MRKLNLTGGIAIYALAILFFASCLAGCTTVRTYSEDKARVDQNLRQGNQGFLMGQSSEPPAERKLTRRTYVTEIELGFPGKKKKAKTATAGTSSQMVVESVQEPAGESVIEEEMTQEASPKVAGNVTTYTVQPNDTLQKISLKLYGSTKQWKKIFDANSDRLKSPDRIYAGQVLNIPQD